LRAVLLTAVFGTGGSMYGSIYGLKVVSAPMAREVRDEYRVERHPTKKRRKQWRVVKHHIDRPCFYRAGDTLFVHPELIAKLKMAVPNDQR
jgi:hypothetical protein